MDSYTVYSIVQEEILMKPAIVIPVEQLREEPYAAVLCYPKPIERELESRVVELQSHGVTAIEFSGKTSVYGMSAPVLGKGYVGIVVIAHRNRRRIALKIRRLDADRADLFHEAQMLKKANNVKVGPKFIGVSKNFLLMQLIEGDLLPAWLHANKEKRLVQKVLQAVLENCYRLDELGLDHGELSKAPKHVIVDYQQIPFIVDFETASEIRRTANLSALCHFLFISKGETAQTIAEIIGERKKDQIREALQAYKRNRTFSSFEFILRECLN